MDPWGGCQENITCLEYNISLKFEDNFTPLVRDCLPDSEQYLAILESRLKRLKNDPNILRQLAEKREACMQQLLNGNSAFRIEESDETFAEVDVPVASNQLLRTVLPHKQALNQCEVVELVKYDQLSNDYNPEPDTVPNNTHNPTF